MLHFTQCNYIVCNYYTMYQTLYLLLRQRVFAVRENVVRGIGQERQGCTKGTIDYPQPFVHSVVTTCVIHLPDFIPYDQPNDPFCVSEYMAREKNRFLFLANMNGGGFSLGFLILANIDGGNPRSERVFVYAPWGVLCPTAYQVNRFISGQYKDVVKVKFEDIFNHNIWYRYIVGVLYVVVWQQLDNIVTKVLRYIA